MAVTAQIGIAKGEDPYAVARRALDRLDPTPVAGHNVLLKPRGAMPLAPETGGSTHPGVIEAAIDWLRENHARAVAVAERPALGVAAQKAFFTSLEGLCARKDVPLINIDHSSSIWLDIFEGRLLQRVSATGILVDYDFIVSMPTLSTSRYSGVALSLENIAGLVARHHKLRLHPWLRMNAEGGGLEREIMLADLTRALYPDMVIIDGIVGMQGDGPFDGYPKNAGLVIAGDDALTADRIGCELMGIHPDEIKHLKLVGQMSEQPPAAANVEPGDWQQWMTLFQRPETGTPLSRAVLEIYNHKGCTSCQNSLYRFLEQHYLQMERGHNMRFSIGPEGPQCPAGTCYVGNCAVSRDTERSGYHCNGCPPQPRQIWDALQKLYAGAKSN
jgi:uncharacterized protein (DUF362 family)